jgi:biopolymer transport protein ExbD
MTPRRRLQQLASESVSNASVLTPMVDIVFLLMIFFLFGSIDFSERQIMAALSQSGPGQTQPGTTIWLRLRPAAGGALEYAVDDAAYLADAEAVFAGIDLACRGAVAPRVIVDPESGVNLQHLVDVMARARQCGAEVALHAEMEQP